MKHAKKKHHVYCIKQLNQLKELPTSRMKINDFTFSSLVQREHRNRSVTVQTVYPVDISMLVSNQHIATVAEWSNACPALKDSREFENIVCLWLLRAWVRVPAVVIFSHNQRLFQIVIIFLRATHAFVHLCFWSN